jgi:hypothetical protein
LDPTDAPEKLPGAADAPTELLDPRAPERAEPRGARDWLAPARATGRWVLGNRLTLAAGLAAAVPVIASTVRGLAEGWVPFGDQAIIATRAYDVFTSHMPLLGQYSASTHVTKHFTYSLGPLLYWLLALPARLGPPGAIALTMGIVNAAAVVWTVALARRRGGVPLMVAAAVAIALMTRSLGPETYHDPWNPSAAVVPLMLLIFLCWSLACGEYRLLPLAVLTASFAVQCHLAYLLPSLGLLAIGMVGLVASRRSVAAPGGHPWRWALAALAVLAVCWSAPIVDELSHNPGNITTVVDTGLAHQRTVGWATGWHTVVRAIGITPWWLRTPVDPFYPLTDIRTPPSGLAVGSTIAILALLALATLVGLVRRRADLAAGGAISLVLAASLAAVTAHTPSEPALMSTLGYSLWWGSPAGMAVWLIGGWALASLIAAASRPALRRPARPRRLPALAPAASVLGLVAAAGAAGAAAAEQQPDQHHSMYRPISRLVPPIERAVPKGTALWLDGSAGFTTVLRAGVRYQLRQDGIRAFALNASHRLGGWYDLDHHRYDYKVYIQDNDKFPVKLGRVVAHVRWIDGTELHNLTVRVWRTSALAQR